VGTAFGPPGPASGGPEDMLCPPYFTCSHRLTNVPTSVGRCRHGLLAVQIGAGDLVRDDQVKAGKAGTEWTGVKNFAARNHMRAMKKGDQGFFYHSGAGKSIVGVVEVVKTIHPDSTDGAWECVDIAAVKPVKKPVTLEQVKADKKLADMALVRLGRLSVQPVTDEEWKIVSKMAGL
jgi:predicted RNA-binding protein with PUA-like domain